MKHRLVICSSIISILVAGSAFAGEVVNGSENVNATGPCNGALPSYEGSLRKRPLGIANEGTSAAFLSCALVGSGELDYHLQLGLTNRGMVDATVNCTYVDGYAPAAATYYPKSVVVPASNQINLNWIAGTDSEADNFSSLASFSCVLPPGIELNWVYRAYGENPF